jgi:DNA-binding MarR family transcriptional regulator
MSTDQLLDRALDQRLTTREMAIVRALAPDGTVLTMSTLANRLRIVPASATVSVDRLVRRGLATRIRSTSDRRQVGVSLSFHGRRTILGEES